ncbi:DUF4179 domain-containing protein [Bacillus sp. 1P10SD]|uniref:DUF4179 domain-containing protein n=1 Tax=Bacillus sp. 1P10SD TaxID=3132265 RepID=UPI0039A5B901
MYEKEERQLTNYKNSYDNIEAPLELLDEAILNGFMKAKAEKRRKPLMKKWVISIGLAAFILIGFFSSIRLSPAFANYITVIPGMEKLVELIRNDKGKMLAVENDYYEKLGVSQEKNGMTFTIDGAITDENGLVLFYTVESDNEDTELNIDEPRLNYKDGQSLNWGSLSHSSGEVHTDGSGKSISTGTLEVGLAQPLESKELELKVKVKRETQTEDFVLPFQLKKEVQEKKTYQLNKTVTIEGQKITFLDTTIYPLRVAVHIKMDHGNTKKILNFDDLRLVDENGEVWNKIANGVSASKISDDEAIIYLQSNYFREPKELYLVFNKIQAVDKEEAMVMIDTQKKQILKQPKENVFSNLIVDGEQVMLTMQTKNEFHYSPFGEAKDRKGNIVEVPESSMSPKGGDERVIELGLRIPELQKVMNPISFELSFFPAWIKGETKVQIK